MNDLPREALEFYIYWKKRGVAIPNPQHYPIKFKYLVDLFYYYKRTGEVK